MDELLVGARIKWIGDRINALASVAPRHIGRVTRFEYFDTEEASYSYVSVMGTLDGYTGNEIVVSG
jgi:hypothetical protein